MVVVVSGPSGVGKSTICKAVVNQLDDVVLSISVTTRPKAEDEVNGRDYRFIKRPEFEEKIDKGLMLEYAEVFGNLYGTYNEQVEKALKEGKTIILEIDVQGGRQVKARYPDAVMIFILPPSQAELAKRMELRGRDDLDTAEKRLGEASNEVAAAWQYYQHIVINEELQQAVNEVVKIIETESGR